MESKLCMTPREAAKASGVSYTRMLEWIHDSNQENRPPGFWVSGESGKGRRYLIVASELPCYLSSRGRRK